MCRFTRYRHWCRAAACKNSTLASLHHTRGTGVPRPHIHLSPSLPGITVLASAEKPAAQAVQWRESRESRGAEQSPPSPLAAPSGAHHDGNVVPAVEGQRAVHVHQVVLRLEEAVKVLRVVAHLLGHRLQPPSARQHLHEEELWALRVTARHLHYLQGMCSA